MAGEWIKLEHTLPEKPEVMRMARILKIDPDAVVGKLARLWGWIDGVSVDGSVDGVVAADVDSICRCVGFASACVLVGWLSVDESAERVTLPNFDNHNGETAKKRALKNRRQAKWRANVDEPASTPASTSASTREEKRREEEKQENGADAPTPKKSRKREEVTFTQWTESLPADADAIPGDDPVFAYADRVGLPRDYIALEWAWFEAKYSGPDKGKRYADWRQHFRNAVEGGWGNLWRVNATGEYYLTTQGVQAQRALA